MALGTMVISIIYIILLKWFTKPLLYIAIFGLLIVGGLAGFFLFEKAKDYPVET